MVFYRGKRYRLGDRRALEQLEPFRQLGYDVMSAHLLNASEGARHGDLVLYGAFAEAGNIAFDFEFGLHGGLSPEELDQFLISPADVELSDELMGESVPSEAFYRFFSARYSDARRAPPDDNDDHDGDGEDPASHPARDAA